MKRNQIKEDKNKDEGIKRKNEEEEKEERQENRIKKRKKRTRN